MAAYQSSHNSTVQPIRRLRLRAVLLSAFLSSLRSSIRPFASIACLRRPRPAYARFFKGRFMLPAIAILYDINSAIRYARCCHGANIVDYHALNI